MFFIVPEFMRCAAGLPDGGEAKAGSRSGADAASGENGDKADALTLEMRDSPFASLMKYLETLMDTDPKEALRLLKTVLADKIFTAPRETARLAQTLDQIIIRLKDAVPTAAGAFLLSLHNISLPAMRPDTETLTPVLNLDNESLAP